ncbi:MAG: chemotaxis protein CheW [Planctomycetes bacterium]|nr:chemotaxis protein CheW [Planctomycetota bacterium]
MRHLCVMIGGSRFAVPASEVREVGPAVAARTMSGVPIWCRGFACARGQWMPLVHAAALLGMPLTPPTTLSRTLLLDGSDDPSQSVLIEVDAVEDLVQLERTGIHPGLHVPTHPWLGSVHPFDDGSVQVLLLGALRQHPEWRALAREAPAA